MTFEEYEKIVIDWTATKIEPLSKPLLANQTPKEFKTSYFPMLFDGLKGVSDSFEAMKFSLTLLKSDFPTSENVRREQYLEYIVHAFYSDCYVLKELLKGYTNKIQKVYGKALPNESVKLLLEPVFESLSNDIEPLMNIRNAHVHQERFKGGGLRELSVLSVAAQFNSSLISESEEAFLSTLDSWVAHISRIVDIYTLLLNECFDHISEIVIEDGAVREPE